MVAKGKKGEVKKLIPIIESDEFTDSESMAEALLDLFLNDIMPKREKFMVVGQLWPRKGGVISDDEGKDLRVALGPFDTMGNAKKAGESLALNHATGEQAKWWAMPVYHGTPNEWYAGLKKKHQREKLFDTAAPRDVRQAMREQWFEEHPGEALPEHLQGMGWEGLDEFTEYIEREEGEHDDHL